MKHMQSVVDTMKSEEVRQLQLERLQVTLNRAYFNVDFYRARMDSLGMLPEDFASQEDFTKFPFTTREDLAQHYPYGLFAVPLRSIIRLKITTPIFQSGHQPIVVGFTRHDAAMWQDLMVRLFRQLEITDRDIVQVAFNFSLFPGAFTFNAAAEALGATLAPSATSSATLQLQVMQDFRSTVLTTTPAFALHIAGKLASSKIDPKSLHLRMIVVGPEPLPELTRRCLESAFGVPVYGLYGLVEMVEPGIAGECPAKDGLHLAEDQFLAEIIHPVTGEVLPAGQEGELVLTTLTAEAYPLVRYRTGDVTVLRPNVCSCGRASARIVPILRRTDNRVSVRGIPIYPEQVEAILRQLDSRIEDFRLVIESVCGVGEQLELLIVRPSDTDFPEGSSRSYYMDTLRAQLRRAFGLGARIQIVETHRLPKEGLIYKTVFRSMPHQGRYPFGSD